MIEVMARYVSPVVMFFTFDYPFVATEFPIILFSELLPKFSM